MELVLMLWKNLTEMNKELIIVNIWTNNGEEV